MLPPRIQRSISRLEGLIAEADKLKKYEHVRDVQLHPGLSYDPLGKPTFGARSVQHKYTVHQHSDVLLHRTREAIKQIAPDSVYWEAAIAEDSNTRARDAAFALCEDLKAGYYDTASQVAHAEIFSDMLEEADYLLVSGYTVAAAVLAGSTAESHLRQLAVVNGIPTKKDDGKPLAGAALNIELARAKVYDLNTSKLLTAWQGIRNDAAHGATDKVDGGQVRLMIDGIRLFLSNHPA